MLESLGYLGLFISSLISATVVPMSSEAVLTYLFYEGYSVYGIIVVASIGNTIGGMTGYYLGKLGRWEKLQKWFGIKEEKIQTYEARVTKYGKILAFLCWLPLIGDFIAVALGYYRMGVKGVLFFMFLGKFLRYVVVIWVMNYFY